MTLAQGVTIKNACNNNPPHESLAQCFSWLAAVFERPPDTISIAAYRRGPAAVWLKAIAAQPLYLAGVGLMQKALGEPQSDHALAASLGAAHALLFAGLGGPKTVSPYESAYCSAGRLFQEPVSHMEELLFRHGLAVSADCAEAADHLSIELALLAYLVAGNDPDAEVVALRLSDWAPRFRALCSNQDQTGFWAGAATVLCAALEIGTSAQNNYTAKIHLSGGGFNDHNFQT